MKCKYERCIDKLERWCWKEKQRIKYSMAEHISPEHFKHGEGQIKAIDNMFSIIHNYKLKANKMKV